MKITVRQLRRVISEEVERVLSEGFDNMQYKSYDIQVDERYQYTGGKQYKWEIDTKTPDIANLAAMGKARTDRQFSKQGESYMSGTLLTNESNLRNIEIAIKQWEGRYDLSHVPIKVTGPDGAVVGTILKEMPSNQVYDVTTLRGLRDYIAAELAYPDVSTGDE